MRPSLHIHRVDRNIANPATMRATHRRIFGHTEKIMDGHPKKRDFSDEISYT